MRQMLLLFWDCTKGYDVTEAHLAKPQIFNASMSLLGGRREDSTPAVARWVRVVMLMLAKMSNAQQALKPAIAKWGELFCRCARWPRRAGCRLQAEEVQAAG